MGQPQGLPLQLILAMLKLGTLGARASGPHAFPSRILMILQG
jgi:hypothetical protein